MRFSYRDKKLSRIDSSFDKVYMASTVTRLVGKWEITNWRHVGSECMKAYVNSLAIVGNSTCLFTKLIKKCTKV